MSYLFLSGHLTAMIPYDPFAPKIVLPCATVMSQSEPPALVMGVIIVDKRTILWQETTLQICGEILAR